MSFNDNAKLEGGKVSKRGRNVGIGAGVGGLGVIAVVLIGQFLGVDLSGLVGGGGSSSSSDEQIQGCETGKDANTNVECRMEGAAESLDAYWAGDGSAALGVSYHSPAFSLFTDSTQTGCGNATSAVGPFYCPPDERIYLDTAFYDELRDRFGSSGGPLAQMYVVAHEWGHHIQNLAGTLSKSQDGDTGPTSASVRTELQADCFAGAWVANASTAKDASGVPLLQPVTKEQITDALSAAAAVGDDRIQQSAGQGVNPESWTHGSSASRQKWFEAGFNGGPTACDTFSASGSAL
ncbi:neutral zinc metallopeptidase [Glaciibacter flavus]|uniref:Neutral zinc metallopeptidase n=1 Tax=Orlajensenia flava TaxID=2565934 RepID=A0A4S4FGC3_9MICO|nr:neutral zinc metallopeptidase [Glaciibacter flavus]THG29038.1 neutral zinc metallopeptidase [Glaciibacter flavus]